VETRRLGRRGPDVSVIGFGAWAIGSGWGPQEDQASIAALHRALDLGVTFIDSALAYGNGRSERLVGQVLRERGDRGRVAVATKVPPRTGRWSPPPGTPIADVYPPAFIVESCETSLRNLGAEQIDVLQFHTWLDDWNATDEWYETVERLRREGKVRAVGISVPDERPADANGSIERGRLDSVQVVYNVLDQRARHSLFPVARRFGTGIIARVPLASGALSGKFSVGTRFAPGDWRADRFTPEVLARVVAQVERVETIVGDAAPFAHRALQFALASEDVTTVIPGTRTPLQAEENAAAAALVPLAPRALARLYAEGAMDPPPPASPG
jgi:aryl-alcohol dehydrogenase-like predicted oxidoreductase